MLKMIKMMTMVRLCIIVVHKHNIVIQTRLQRDCHESCCCCLRRWLLMLMLTLMTTTMKMMQQQKQWEQQRQ